MQPITFTSTRRPLAGRSLILALLFGFALYFLVQTTGFGQIAQAASDVRGTLTTSNPASAPQTTTPYQQGIVDRTNYYRQQNGCPALTINAKLNASAQGHSDDMAKKDFFSHTGSNGSGPEQRIQAAGYTDSLWAENIAAGYSTPESVVDSWFNETPPNDVHRQNILNCNLSEVGVGYTYLANDTGSVNYNYYWVQDLGTSTSQPPACSAKPSAPTLVTPAAKAQMSGGKLTLDWNDSECAKTYNVVIRRGSKTGTVVANKTGLKASKFKAKSLTQAKYFWRIEACNATGCTAGAWWTFSTSN